MCAILGGGGVYYDTAGNHDAYGGTTDPNGNFDLDGNKDCKWARRYSFMKNGLQAQWQIIVGGHTFQFMTVNTAGHDNKACPLDNLGFNDREWNWIKNNINDRAHVIFIFGHHPIWKYHDENPLIGKFKHINDFRKMLNELGKDNKRLVFYCFGHTHKFEYRECSETGENFEQINCAALSKSKSENENYVVYTIFVSESDPNRIHVHYDVLDSQY
jgi:hypothetical protein